MFEHTSRYFALPNKTYTIRTGREIAYKTRRFLPRGDRMDTLLELTINQGDRLDLIAARTLGDSTQFWQICDANNVMYPDDIIDGVGETIRVAVPQGLRQV
jgi:hypothetical protein